MAKETAKAAAAKAAAAKAEKEKAEKAKEAEKEGKGVDAPKPVSRYVVGIS